MFHNANVSLLNWINCSVIHEFKSDFLQAYLKKISLYFFSDIQRCHCWATKTFMWHSCHFSTFMESWLSWTCRWLEDARLLFCPVSTWKNIFVQLKNIRYIQQVKKTFWSGPNLLHWEQFIKTSNLEKCRQKEFNRNLKLFRVIPLLHQCSKCLVRRSKISFELESGKGQTISCRF